MSVIILRGALVFTTRGMLLGALFCFGATCSGAAVGSDVTTARDYATAPKRESARAVRADQHLKRMYAQRRKAPPRIKRADLFEPRYWAQSASFSEGGAREPTLVVLSRQPSGRMPDGLLMAAPGHMPSVPPGDLRPRLPGQAGGGLTQLAGQTAGQAASAQPAEPTTPFVFAGRMIDKTEVTLFLLGNNRPILAKVNDVIDGTYRVDKISNVSAVLTYLPTNSQQTVIFNSTAIGASVLGGAAGQEMNGNPTDRAGVARQVVGINSPNVAEQLKSR